MPRAARCVRCGLGRQKWSVESPVLLGPGVAQVARCTKIIKPNTDDAKYVINIRQIAKVGGSGRGRACGDWKDCTPRVANCSDGAAVEKQPQA